MRMMTVIMKTVPKARAKSCKRFRSITMFCAYSVEEESSSEVIKRIIAVTASHKLISNIERGKFISLILVEYGTKPRLFGHQEKHCPLES